MPAPPRGLLVLAAGELLLARITSGPQRPVDVAVAAVVWLVLAAVVWRVPRARPPVMVGALVLLSLSIALPPAIERGGPSVPAAAATTVLGVAVGALLLGPAGLGVWALLVSAGVAWAVDTHPPPWWSLTAWAAAVIALGRTARRRHGPGVVAVVVCLAALAPDVPPPLRPGASPTRGPVRDVVIVTVDTLRADVGESFTSYAALATRGRAYEGWSSSSWTLPSLAALWTGVPPFANGAGGHGDSFTGVDPTLPTLAGELHRRGWRTIAITAGNPFVTPRYHLLDDFDELWHPWAPVASPLPRTRSPYTAARPLFSRWLPRPAPPDDADALVDRAIDRLSQGDGPRLLWLHLMDVHLPYPTSPCKPEVLTQPGTRERLLDDPWWRTLEGRACWRRAYDAAARPVDVALQRLFDTLDPRTSIVVLTADHGESLGEDGLEHGHTLAPSVTRVPLVIRAPRTPPPVWGPVALTDIGPTVLSMLGLPVTLPGADLTRGGAVGPTVLSGTLYGTSRAAVVDGPWMLDDAGGTPRLLRWAEPDRVDHLSTDLPAAIHLGAWLPGAPPPGAPPPRPR